MLDPSSTDDFWCPLASKPPATADLDSAMTPEDAAALARLGCGEWISDSQIERLERLGVVEKAFGQALLTRLGRAALGIA